MKLKRVASFIMAFVLTVTCFAGMISGTAEAIWNVKRSEVDYFVDLNGTQTMFLCNRKSIGTKVGTEYYMTYTVESIDNTNIAQTGVIGTNVPNNQYPYVTVLDGKGGAIYNFNTNSQNQQDIMLKKGYTYFLKFTITEDGYKYRVAWAEDASGKSKYIEFQNVIGDVKTDLGYFGLFVAAGLEGVTGKLTKVRFYDKDGNDLGAQSTPNQKAQVGLEKPLTSGITVEHTYDIIMKDCLQLAISNQRKATGDKIYMEYTVKEAEGKIFQTGVVTSDAPRAGYPYLDGYMWFDQYELDTAPERGPLLEPGATYFIIFENKPDHFEVTIQKTVNGKTTLVGFQKTFGTYDEDYHFRSLWFCGNSTKDIQINAVLTGFKCYDSNGNNLGVQLNTSYGEAIHYGEKEDYAGCEAMYYCDDDASLYALYENKSLKFTENDKTTDGTYRIEETTMTVKMGELTKDYEFLFQYFTDENEKVYRRLHTCQLIFETNGGSAVETQILDAENGFKPMRPNEPTMENNSFLGWYTLEGEEFDFDKLVTESTTVYAKWANETFAPANEEEGFVIGNLAYGIGAAAILVAAIACGAIIIVRGKKHGSSK